MDTKKLYDQWLERAVADPDLITELKDVAGKDEEISDRFYRELEFGTGGLRGVIGAGTYRMNYYTVRKATQGLATYVKTVSSSPSVAISYDSRIKSDYFARSAAEVFAGNGIKVHIYSELMPTPMLSYAVRALHCDAGVMVTASHNPAKYNGYKVYGPDGCQVTNEAADKILGYINKTDIFDGVTSMSFDQGVKEGLIDYIGQDTIDAYMKEVRKQAIHPDVCAGAGLKVVYTPLNGTGNKPVRRILKEIGIKDVVVVPEQENPDGTFSTCPYPNPEIREALELGLKLCEKEQPDLLLATDPDCDRVGIAVPDGKGGYALFSGNEVGAMLLEYVARERTAAGTMPKDPVAVKTIVTTELTRPIAKKYGVELIEVLTGFKFIGEQIGFLEKKGEADRYIFGFEESYGYLAGSYVRDKDAVVASMLICEMAAFYRAKGQSLIQVRERLYNEYGFYCNKLDTFAFEGEAGMEIMKGIMDNMRVNYPKEIAGLKVIATADYLASKKTDLATGAVTEILLPKSNVITLYLEKNASLVIRPSGTEPKIKIYYTTVGSSMEEALEVQKKISEAFVAIIKK